MVTTEPLKDWEKVLVLLGVAEVNKANQVKSLALIADWSIDRAQDAFNEAQQLGMIEGPGHAE